MAVTPAVGDRIDVSISGVVVKHDVMNGPRALVELDPTDDVYATKRQVWVTATDLAEEEQPPPQIIATGATAGTPGTFTPEGAVPPGNLSEMGGLAADPVTPWTTGQSVVTGDSNPASWDGTFWVGVVAP